MKPLRILHLIYSSGIYGAEKHLLDLLPALRRLNIHCELLFICPEKNAPELEEYCSHLDQLGVKATLATVTSKMSLFKVAWKISRYLKANNIPVVHSHLFSADLIAVSIKKFFSKDLVILSTKHGYEEEYLVQYGLGNKGIRYNLYYFLSRFIIKNIDHNVAVSDALANMYVALKLQNKKMQVIPHGIALSTGKKPQIKLYGAPRILMVGRLSEIKGHIYLIKALPDIVAIFPALKVYLLGEGELKAALQAEAKQHNVLSHLEFVGFDDPKGYASQCDVMVLPSLFESFGLVYIESFALQIPVIAFDVEAGNQIIENGETGILVPTRDSKILAEKIIYLLSSPDERNRLTESAYKKYLAYFTVERMADDTAVWYQSIL